MKLGWHFNGANEVIHTEYDNEIGSGTRLTFNFMTQVMDVSRLDTQQKPVPLDIVPFKELENGDADYPAELLATAKSHYQPGS